MRKFLVCIVALLVTTTVSVVVLPCSIVVGIIESVKDGNLKVWRIWIGVLKTIGASYKLYWNFIRCNSAYDIDKVYAEFKEEIDAL